MPDPEQRTSRTEMFPALFLIVTVLAVTAFVAVKYTQMINDMRDIHQDVVDDNEERCKSIGADLKVIDGGFGATDTYMCTEPDGTIVEVPEG